jgi:hypothetical protein
LYRQKLRNPTRHAIIPTTIPAIPPGLKCPSVSGEFEFLFGEESLEVIPGEVVEEAFVGVGEESLEVIAGEIVEEALVGVVEVRAGGVVAIFC